MPPTNQPSSSSTNAKQANTSKPHPAKMATEIQPKDYSQYRMVKEMGFDNMYYFMLSYNLKMHNEEDYEEAKMILKAFREDLQEEWEEKNREKKN